MSSAVSESLDTPTPAHLSRIARQLYRHVSRGTRTIQSLRPYICPFHRLVPFVRPGSTVLDVGCGAGLFLGVLSWSGKIKQGIGFDASRSAIAAAQSIEQTLPLETRQRLSFQHVDVRDRWPEGTFDVVALIDVMHHVPPAHQAALMRQAADKVIPGGMLIYKDMARRPIVMAAANRLHDLVMARQWIHYAALADARRWGTETGLTVQEEGRLRMIWYVHEWLIFRKPLSPST